METNKLSILIVDDDDNFREILGTKLKAAGFLVEEASSGEESLEKAGKFEPDLVILDVNMPNLSGVETLSRLKSNPNLAKIKVIFLTSYGDLKEEAFWLDEKFARELGAHDFIRKSDDIDKIVEEIKSVLK